MDTVDMQGWRNNNAIRLHYALPLPPAAVSGYLRKRKGLANLTTTGPTT